MSTNELEVTVHLHGLWVLGDLRWANSTAANGEQYRAAIALLCAWDKAHGTTP